MGIKKDALNIIEIGQRMVGFAEELGNILDDSIREALDHVEEDLDIQFSLCVDAFYDEYTPNWYRRTYSLYEGYKFERGKDGLSFYFETDGSLIPDTHRASPEYIFDLAYGLGQHGGGINNGLYRRYPFTSAKEEGWGDPAKIGSPIDDRIMRTFITYKKSKQLQSYFNHYSKINFKRKIKEYGLDILF